MWASFERSQLGRICAVLLVLWACSRSEGRNKVPPQKVAIMTSVPTFGDGAPCVSYASPFASSLRNSRVQQARHPFEVLVRVPLAAPRRSDEEFDMLVVSPDAEHGVLIGTKRSLLLSKHGQEKQDFPPGGGDATAFRDSVTIAGQYLTWAGEPLHRYTSSPNAAIVRREEQRTHTMILEEIPMMGEHAPPVPSVFLHHQQLDPRGGPTESYWGMRLHGGWLAAAIGADDSPVVVMADRSLHVFSRDPDGTEQHLPAATRTRTLPFAPAQLSLVPPFIMLTEKTAAGTKLHALRGDGAEAWSVAVPWAVRQPPIDGGQGRVYLVGHGLATIDHGELTSLVPSELPLYATAFADGSLAVVAGKELRLLTRAGKLDGKLEALEPLLTPPAIAGDGSVWVASGEAVYIAR